MNSNKFYFYLKWNWFYFDSSSKLVYKIIKIETEFLKGNYVNLSTFSLFGDLSIKEYLHSFLEIVYVINSDFQVIFKYIYLIMNLFIITGVSKILRSNDRKSANTFWYGIRTYFHLGWFSLHCEGI